MHDGIDGALCKIEPDHDAGERGDKKKNTRVDAERLMGVEADSKPRTGQANRRSPGPPPQDESGWYERAQDKPCEADHQFSWPRQRGRRSWNRKQAQMELVDVSDVSLRSRRSHDPSVDRSIPWVDIDRRVIRHLHDVNDIRARRYLDGRDARRAERGLRDPDELIFG